MISAIERHLHIGTRAADGGINWVLELEVKILTVEIMRVKLISRGCSTGSKEEEVMSILLSIQVISNKRVCVFGVPET